MDRVILKVALLVIILGAIGYLWISAETYNCSQCSIYFSNSKVSGVNNDYGTIKVFMTDLFKESKLNDCPIYWDRTRGYVRQ